MSEEKVMKQGEKYESTTKTKKPAGKPVGGGQPPKVPIKLVIIVLSAVILIIVGWFAYDKFLSKDGGEEVTPEDVAELDEGIADEGDIFAFTYTEEDWTALKEAGYTDSEIVEFELSETSVESLLEQATEGKKEEVRTMFKELQKEAMQSGSQEYKNLLNNTWLGLAPMELKGSKDDVFDEYVITENVSYSKIGSRGAQCFIKLNSYKFGTLFHQVTAQRFLELRDTGNLVITYQVTDVNGELVVNSISEEVVDQIPEIGGEK